MNPNSVGSGWRSNPAICTDYVDYNFLDKNIFKLNMLFSADKNYCNSEKTFQKLHNFSFNELLKKGFRTVFFFCFTWRRRRAGWAKRPPPPPSPLRSAFRFTTSVTEKNRTGSGSSPDAKKSSMQIRSKPVFKVC